jgi:NADH:ubiquinone oxidoreductase subunit 2 (subunit N)
MLLFYFVAYLVTNMGAFQIVEVVERETGDCSRSRDVGLADARLRDAGVPLVPGGHPFVVGFWAKLYVFIVA